MNALIKTKLTVKFILRIYKEFFSDLWKYYSSPYPILLFIGTLRRIRRRLKYLWFPKGKGRPSVTENIVDLILDMKRSNWDWGAQRISDELGLLGIVIQKRTVQRILKEYGFITRKTRITPPTWSTFLKSHKELWAMDFASVIDLKCLQIFILVVIDVTSRKLILINVTLNPDRNWIIQQFKNCSINGINLPSAIILDNDGIYGKWIDPTFKKLFEITTCRIPRGSPWLNGRCERLIKSIKHEVLYRIEVCNAEHAMRLCSQYRDYYNNYRPHQAIQGKAPQNIPVLAAPAVNIANFRYNKIKMIDGLITRFEMAA